MEAIMIKTCVVCGKEFESRGKVCSEPCRKEKQRRLSRESARRRYAVNGEKRRAEAREWKAKNRERVAEYLRQWREENRERIAASKREWYRNNRERALETKKAWRVKNIDKARRYEKAANDAWRARNHHYNREYYLRNAEARKDYSRRWKRTAVAAHQLVCAIERYGLSAFTCNFQNLPKKAGKRRIRVRARNRASEKRHEAKRYAALQLVRELQSKGIEALL
jgi:hypothetical protein